MRTVAEIFEAARKKRDQAENAAVPTAAADPVTESKSGQSGSTEKKDKTVAGIFAAAREKYGLTGQNTAGTPNTGTGNTSPAGAELYGMLSGKVRDRDTVQKELDDTNAALKGLKGEPTTLYAALQHQAEVGADVPVWGPEITGTTAEEVKGHGSEVLAQKAELEEKVKLLEDELYWTDYVKYMAMQNDADFAQNSRYRQTGKTRVTPAGETVLSGEDAVYEWINNQNGYRDYYTNTHDSYASDAVNMFDDGRSNMENAAYDQLFDDEVKVYNYLYNTQGEAAADQFLKFMSTTLTERFRVTEEEKATAFADAHPFLSSTMTVLTSPAKAGAYFKQISDYLDDGQIDENAPYNSAVYTSSAIRGKVASKIEESGEWGAVGSFAYQTGMSMGDFLMNTAVAGGNQTLALAIMGSGAAADTTIQAKDRGLSDDQAFALGTIAGAAEILTEKIGLDALFDVDLLNKNKLTYLLKNALGETVEEPTSSLINTMADIYISKDKSQWEQSIKAYEDKGYSESDAFWMATLDQAKSLGLDALGGFASGTTLGGGSIAVNAVGNAINNRLQQTQGGSVAVDTMQSENGQVSQETATEAKPGTLEWVQELNDLGAGSQNGEQTNAVSKPLNSYPVEKQRTIQSYIRAVNQKLKSFVQSVKSGDLTFKRHKISDVSERAVSDIRNILGIDVSGYTHNINTHGVQHILNRHGENGKQDKSMSVDDDIARIGWVLENYDSIELLTEDGKQIYSSEFLDTNHEPAPQIRFAKQIDGTYYVVEAAFENEYKKLWVQSAYLQKNEDVTQTPAEGTATNHETNAQSASVSPSSIISISQTDPGVNTVSEKSVDADKDALAHIRELVALGQSGSDGQQTEVDTSSQSDYDNVNEHGGDSYATEKQTSYRDDRGLSVRNDIERRTPSDSNGTKGSGIFSEQRSSERTSRSSVYNQSDRGRGVTANASADGFSRYDGSVTFDSEGNELTPENIVKLNGTTALDASGKPMMVYHGTPNMDFTSFEKGDTGHHYGTMEQAQKRIADKHANKGRVFRGYVLIHNPIFSETDIGRWDAEPFSLYLRCEGILSDAEYAEIQNLLTGDHEIDKQYDAPAAVRLREILEQKGYDGVIYSNFFEGDNLSYMVFRDDQFIRVGIDEYNADSHNNEQPTRKPTDSVGAAPAGFAENTVGSAQSRFEHKQGTSRVYSNTYANASKDAVRKVGEESKAADPNIDKYDAVTEKESVYNAMLRARSADEIEFEYEDLLNKSGWSGEDNDTATLVLDYLRKNGDTERFTELARKRREESTRSGQLVQSFAKYSRMSATDCVLDAVETIDGFAKEDIASRHYKGQDFDQWKKNVIKTAVDVANQIDAVEDGDVEGMKEIIRSLARFRKTTAWFGTKSELTKIAEAALKDIDFDTAKAIANAQLSTLPKDFQKRSVGQVVKTIRIHNMLSALTTVNRNLAGNASIGIIDAVSDSTVGRALDHLVSKATNKRVVGNDVTHAKTYFEGATKATKLAALCAELDIPMESESRFSTGMTRTYSPQGGPVTRFLSAFEKGMRYALEVTDQFYAGGTNATVEKSLENLGGKSNLTAEEAAKVAKLVGEQRTFKDDRMVRRAALGVKKGLDELGTGNIGVGDLVLPFAGTGSNVGQVAIDYTSLGVGGFVDIFRLMYDVKTGKYKDGVKQIKKNGKVIREVSLVEAQRQAITKAARGLTGTGLIAAFTALAAAGILGVHDDEDKDKRGLEQSLNLSGAQLNMDAAMRWVRGESTEWQDGDWCLSVDFLEPFNAQMYIGYLLSQEDNVQEMVKAYPQNAVAGVYQSVMDMPMMQGLSDFSDLVTGVGNAMSEGGEWQDVMREAGGQLLGNTASGFIPSWMRQTAQVIDPYYRDTSGETAGERAVNQIFAMIPGLSTTLPKKYSGLGQEQRRYDDLLTGIFNTYINPGELEQIKMNDVNDYLDELSERTGDVTFYPAYMAPGSFKQDGEKIVINGKEDTENYQKAYGENVNRLYGELIQNEDFRNATDEMQIKILNNAKDYAAMMAKSAVSDYHEEPSYITDRAEGMSAAEALLRHTLLVDSDGKTVKGTTEKYSYLSVPEAAYVTELLDGLYAEAGRTNVRDIQRIEAITGADDRLTEAQQKQVLEDTLTESAYDKYLAILELGMDNDDYAASYRTWLDEKETGGKGTKDRIITAFCKELRVSESVAEKLYNIYAGKK